MARDPSSGKLLREMTETTDKEIKQQVTKQQGNPRLAENAASATRRIARASVD
jgi:hypothetical protein